MSLGESGFDEFVRAKQRAGASGRRDTSDDLANKNSSSILGRCYLEPSSSTPSPRSRLRYTMGRSDSSAREPALLRQELGFPDYLCASTSCARA